MPPTYLNRGCDSGIRSYEIGPDWISVRFSDGAEYRYTAARIGAQHLAEMHRLAAAGQGLNSYINRHPTVRKGCDRG
jgi:hypothetical protein